MATLGLQAEVTANVGGFKRGLAEAESRTASFASSIKRVAIAAAASFGVTRIAQFAAGLAEGAEKATLLAERMGATTAGLQGLGYAAEMAGMDSAKLEKGLVTMHKAIAGGAAEFAQLGLSISDLSAMKSDQAMLRIAEALGKVDNKSTQVALSMKIFGKEGARIAQIANDSKGGLSAMAEEARAIGVAMDDLALKKFGQMDDGIDRLTASLKGMAQTILSELGPAIEKAGELGVGVAAGLKARAERKQLANMGDQERTRWTTGESDRADPWGAYYGRQNRLDSQLRTGKIDKKTYDEGIKDAQTERDRALGEDPAKSLNAVAEKVGELADALNEKYKTTDPTVERNKIAAQLELGNISQQVADAAYAAIDKADPMTQAAEQVFKSVITPAEKYANEMTKLAQLVDAGKISEDTAMRAQDKAFSEYGKSFKASSFGESREFSGLQNAARLQSPDNPQARQEALARESRDYLRIIADKTRGPITPQYAR